MRRSSWFVPVLILVILAFAFVGDASACPNCKEAMANQPESRSLQQGYFYSILFMIGMPFAMLGTGTLMVVRAVKRGGLPEF